MNSELINAFVGNYGPAVTLIVVVTVSLISILRLGIKLDINQFLSMRKKRHLALARSYCPHMRFTVTNNDIEIQSLFFKRDIKLDLQTVRRYSSHRPRQ